MPTGSLLSDKAKRTLDEIVRSVRQQTSSRGVPFSEIPGVDSSSQVYLVWVTETIPATTAVGDEPGTGTTPGTGTSTGTVGSGGTIGIGYGAVYAVKNDQTVQRVGKRIIVHNSTSSIIPAGKWVVVAKDAFGRWWATGDAGGLGSTTGNIEMVDVVHVVTVYGDGTGTAIPGTGTGPVGWKCVTVAHNGLSFYNPADAWEYLDVYEGKSRPSYPGTPAIKDEEGFPTHATPLYRNVNDPPGVYFINFPGGSSTLAFTTVTDVTNAICAGTGGGFTFDVVDTTYEITIDFGEGEASIATI